MDVEIMKTDADRLPTDTPIARASLAIVRIVFGLLWLTNVSWKRPPDFDTLRHFTEFAVTNPVFAPYSFVVENVVLRAFTPFGYLVLITEASIGAFLILGLATRFWALVGLVQTTAIALSVINAPHEWSWAYYMMAMGHLAIFATAAGRVFGLDGLFRPVFIQGRGRIARTLELAS